MLSDKEQKKEFLKQTRADPDSFYATRVLRRRGFHRAECTTCSKFFWSTDATRKVCGDSFCVGKVDFTDNPAKRQLSFIDVWKTFSDHLAARGYAKVPRYPVVARWNPTTDFTMASIAAFQPYVISGEVEPPAKRLVIPQFCLRFGDVDNVGVTGSHCTGFVMIGQHQFVAKSEWDQDAAFEDLLSYLTDVVGLPDRELTLHEDAWAGGGNFGPCMEFFSRGVELCNQVYMMFEQREEGNRELSIKVLDMGLGQERVAWFSQGAPTLYDAAFPSVITKLKAATGVKADADLFKRFAPYSSQLNLDEVEDISAAWTKVASLVGVPAPELRSTIEPMTGLYSVAEHARALLIAISDGGLPGNVGGYYNLRVIFRRAQGFIDKYCWNVDMADVAEWHARELEPVYPELLASIEDVKKILTVEKRKYDELKARNDGIIDNALKKPVTTETLLELYDSNGILPELVARKAKASGIAVAVPDNFFKLLEERQAAGQKAQKTQTKVQSELPLHALAPTKPLYYTGYDVDRMDATVLYAEGTAVVLDQTVFYPTSGGQLHDTGVLTGTNGEERVVNVYKQGKYVVHVTAAPTNLRAGETVHGTIDLARRVQLAQHHTAAHVINGAAREVLGDHIWQAGAAKTVEKGRLDITHYENLTNEELRAVEAVANRVIDENKPVVKLEMAKNAAEARYGFRLYQGGAVPGSVIRVITIDGFDTEACGGTHLHTTGELKRIKLLKSGKVQDGVVRIEFVAGAAAEAIAAADRSVVRELEELFGTPRDYLPARCAELFALWKKAGKARKDGKPLTADEKKLTSAESFASGPGPTGDADVIAACAQALGTNKDHVVKTAKRFWDELHQD